MITSIKMFRSIKLLVAFLTFSLFACGSGGSDTGGEAGEAEQLTSIVVIGDSISTGFNIATPWPNLLAGILNVPIDNNNSVSGVLTSYGLGVIEPALRASQPSDVIIMLGTNDAIRGSVSDAISNLQAMIDIANNLNVRVTIATLPPITNSSSNNQDAADISAAIRGFSNVRVADVRAAFGSGSGLIADGVHPNAAGQQLIASTVASLF